MMVEHRVVMITGASKGLGRALAHAFAKQGARLAISARGEKLLMEAKRELEEMGAEVLAVRGDMADARDVEMFVSLAEDRFGTIDVLINNASIFGPSPSPYLFDYPEEDFREVIRVNALGPFLVTKRVLAGMLARDRGVIINVTSEAGRVGYAGWGAYGISKFAVEGMTQTWAEELEGTGVRIYAVDPGEMDTEMHALAVPDCDYPLAKPEEVVGLFLDLANEETHFLSGTRIEAQEWKREEGRGND